MSAGFIREMQENVAKYGRQNTTTLLMVQAIREIQTADAERDRLKALNAELAAAVQAFLDYDEETTGLGLMAAYDDALTKSHAALAKNKETA